MRGDGCFIIGRAANIKSDFYYSGDKENPEPRYVPAPEELRYELDPEFAEPQEARRILVRGDGLLNEEMV